MTLRNADLPTRAEVLEHGPALLPDWLEMHLSLHCPVAWVWLVEPGKPGDRLGWVISFKHQHLTYGSYSGFARKRLTATDWQGMVREAVEILEGER